MNGHRADSQTICAALQSLHHAVRNQSASPPQSQGFDTCERVQTAGGAQEIHCRWRFSYRDVAAMAWFEDLTAGVTTCLKDAVPEPREPGVNHPDMYLLQEFADPQTTIYTSLKDKAVLDSTFVFLRLAALR